MEEIWREYKKRVDEKWINNEKNKDKLIEKIDEYELLDPSYKKETKQQILDNFSKNQKAEKECEKYISVVSELEKIDEKYKELEELNKKLDQKIGEWNSLRQKFSESEPDGSDETTLNIQMANMRTLMEKCDNLENEMVELAKEIENRKQEIQEIESIYGVKEDEVPIEQPVQTEAKSSIPTEKIVEKPSTLKAHHEQTIKDLWNKDHTRGEIINLLEDGTGIDEELKEKIKKEVSDRFFEYYDKKQGDIKTQAARFMKNKVKSLQTFEELMGMPEGPEKEEKLKEIEDLEQTYGLQGGRMRLLLELKKEGFDVKSLEIEEWGIIAGLPVFKVKAKTGEYRLYRGTDVCGDWCSEIGDIQEIGAKPCFKVKSRYGDCCVYWGRDKCGDWCSEIGEIQNIRDMPCFKVKYKDDYYQIYWGTNKCGERCEEIGDIVDVGQKPCFKTKNSRGKWDIVRGNNRRRTGFYRILSVLDVGGKPVYECVNDYGYSSLYWAQDRILDSYKEIWDIQDLGGRPSYKTRGKNGSCTCTLRWRKNRENHCSQEYEEIKDIKYNKRKDRVDFTGIRGSQSYKRHIG